MQQPRLVTGANSANFTASFRPSNVVDLSTITSLTMTMT